jgi:E3 ubiquitin-protein ligase SHPRH
LQEISDSVAEVDFEGSVVDAIKECVAHAIQLDDKIKSSKARARYLENLTNEDAMKDEDGQCCIL